MDLVYFIFRFLAKAQTILHSRTLLFLLFTGSPAYAGIEKKIDTFDESLVCFSFSEIGKYNRIQFNKKYSADGTTNFIIYLSTSTVDKNKMYSRDNVKIKVDNTIFEEKVISTDRRQYIYSSDSIIVKVDLSSQLIEQLTNAKKVTMRIYYENGMADTIDIPDKVLIEWKQVIAMEK